MALTDLIRKRATGQNASAIHAIPAIREGRGGSKIAGIAAIAVARPKDGETDAGKIAGIAGIALARPNAAEVGILEKLRLFRFDLVAQDIEGGYPAVRLDRVNNMAWEFMQADGMAFSDALHLAAQVVAECDVAASEQAYEDVRALWRRLTRNLD
ncbi:MAG: hypothetical protein NVS2B7_17190 [Herpetosiphon sp.]